jgi:hypothetical protein
MTPNFNLFSYFLYIANIIVSGPLLLTSSEIISTCLLIFSNNSSILERWIKFVFYVILHWLVAILTIIFSIPLRFLNFSSIVATHLAHEMLETSNLISTNFSTLFSFKLTWDSIFELNPALSIIDLISLIILFLYSRLYWIYWNIFNYR